MRDLIPKASLQRALTSYVDIHSDRLVEIVRDLVRIPSENSPPAGREAQCQEYVARFLRGLDLDPDVYTPDSIGGIHEHPLYFAGRDYTNRPNVNGRRSGRGGGRSLILSGHIDTVPRGTQSWTRDPFGAEIDGNRLYGRGSNDMKAGVGINLFVLQAITQLGLQLCGDLIFETVVDEEFGGSNGTLAGRLKGYLADAAVISEPTSLRVCPAQRGGRTAHITLTTDDSVQSHGALSVGISRVLCYFLTRVEEFAAQRRASAPLHKLYLEQLDPVPVSITKIVTSPWGSGEPITTPDSCRLEMYWQTMPGERQGEVEQEFFTWIDSVVSRSQGLISKRPEVNFPIRWLPGSSISEHDPLVTELAASAAAALDRTPIISGIEGPCDLYVFQEGFGIPSVLWGAKGCNTHGPDEYVEIDSVVQAAQALLQFVCSWCGLERIN